MHSSERKRERTVYRGRVQGVGFRATVYSIARRYRITGYVKNLRDGTVELVVDGSAAAVDAVRKAIDASFGGYIEGAETESLEGSESLDGFQIRY